ncbi:MAG: carbohydrate-binding protein [Bacteroidia bacterium]|nr:carbohydrate-binding protein [Bacteroidia bacterium]
MPAGSAWKTRLDKQNGWISYNGVDFGNKRLRSVLIKASSQTGGTLQIHLDKVEGTLLAEVKIPKGTGWNTINARLLKYQKGIHNLIVSVNDNNPVEVDWISFIK